MPNLYLSTKRKYSLEKAIADTRTQGKLILDEDQVHAINEFLIELKAFKKIVRKIHSLSSDLETFALEALGEEKSRINSSYNNPNDPNNYQYQQMIM